MYREGHGIELPNLQQLSIFLDNTYTVSTLWASDAQALLFSLCQAVPSLSCLPKVAGGYVGPNGSLGRSCHKARCSRWLKCRRIICWEVFLSHREDCLIGLDSRFVLERYDDSRANAIGIQISTSDGALQRLPEREHCTFPFPLFEMLFLPVTQYRA